MSTWHRYLRKPSVSAAIVFFVVGTLCAAEPEHVRQQLERMQPAAVSLAFEDMIQAWPDRCDAAVYRKTAEAFARDRDALMKELSAKTPGSCERAVSLMQGVQTLLLANPALDFDKLLVVKRNPANMGLPQNWASNAGLPRHGFDNEIAVLSPVRPDGELRTLFRPDKDVFVGDLKLHWDADRLLFSSIGTNGRWQVMEARTDGAGVRELPLIPDRDVDNYDACYLPDGRIIFNSTATFIGVPCVFGSEHISNLYLFDPLKSNIRRVCFEQEHDWSPTVLNNGRVLYQRWEYSDLPHSNSRYLFHMNPDGTDQREYYKSSSYFPNSLFYAKPVPGQSTLVVAIAGGHHGSARVGRLLIIDPARGRKEADGVVQEIPGYGKPVEPIVRDSLVAGVWPQFLHPVPLGDPATGLGSGKYFLVAAKLNSESLWGIYLVDIFDNMTLIKSIDGYALLEPGPLKKMPMPPVVPDRVDLARNEALVLLADIYKGEGLKGIPRGSVKNLRLIEYYFSPRGVGGLMGTIGANGPWDIKRVLGTVPVAKDGSAKFMIPANTSLSIQPLDEKGQALQLMRSWFVGMPGENVSCTGCHERQSEAAQGGRCLAFKGAPSRIEPWLGPTHGFSFVRDVQPVLDRHCVSCHDGNAPSRPYLKGDKIINDWKSNVSGSWGGQAHFSQSYIELQRYVRRPGIESDIRVLTPMEYHVSTTTLGQLLRKGHHGVTLDAEAIQRLETWIDLNAPFHGTWGEIVKGKVENPSVKRGRDLRQRYAPNGPAPDYEDIPVTPKYDSTPVKPVERVAATTPVANPSGWPFSADEAQALQTEAVKVARATNSITTIDLGEGVTLDVVMIPGGNFVMGSLDGHADERPRSVVSVKPFRIGRTEISNKQFQRFNPNHDSRHESKYGYQFGQKGFPMTGPDQPVVRVSWQEATEFCAWLTRRARETGVIKRGQKFTLPTEAQWEYACRAGTETPFWFGSLDTDFGKFANVADKAIIRLVIDPYSVDRAINPTPYDDNVPRDSRFDDGAVLTVPVGRYEPNPWGLRDMHGNAAEWTRSAYRPYPYREDDGRNDAKDAAGIQRVVRGGSWYDRPKYGTSSYRLFYADFQKVFNVGFRVVVEE